MSDLLEAAEALFNGPGKKILEAEGFNTPLFSAAINAEKKKREGLRSLHADLRLIESRVSEPGESPEGLRLNVSRLIDIALRRCRDLGI